jgi:hypothetical protein
VIGHCIYVVVGTVVVSIDGMFSSEREIEIPKHILHALSGCT